MLILVFLPPSLPSFGGGGALAKDLYKAELVRQSPPGPSPLPEKGPLPMPASQATQDASRMVQDGPDIDPRWPQDDPSWPQQVQDGARIAEAWPKSAILEAMPQKVEKRGSTAFRGAWLDFNVFLLCFGCVDFSGFD